METSQPVEQLSITEKKIHDIQPQELKTAVMIKVKTATFQPDYYAKELQGGFSFPWVIRKRNYKRDGRNKLGE